MKPNGIPFLASILLPALLSAGCQYEALDAAKGLTSLRVTLENEGGSAAHPLDPGAGLPVQVKVEALDETGREMSGYEGHLTFRAKTGFLGRNGWEEADVEGGDTVTLSLVRGFGPVRILAEDTEHFVVGVSEPVYLPEPTLSTIQTPTGSIDASPWADNFLRIESGRMVVTYAAGSGFYATDVRGSSYNHLYIYTHGFPSVDRGDVLSWVSGTVSEFYGFTELSFPDYGVRCHDHPLPEPVALTKAMLADDAAMESLEGGLVSAGNVSVAYVNTDAFFKYGQWSGRTGDGGAVTVMSLDALPEFNPLLEKGVRFEKLTGVLRQHWSADSGAPKGIGSEWILTPRDLCDVTGYGDRPDACDDEPPATDCDFGEGDAEN